MEEILGRIKTAIEFLRDGLPFKVGELYLGMSEGNILDVEGISQYIDLKNVTKQGAMKELEEIKSMFEKMISVSFELKNFVSEKKVRYNLDFRLWDGEY